jgi:hypothetical protein
MSRSGPIKTAAPMVAPAITATSPARVALSPAPGPLLQRVCTCGGKGGAVGKCVECETREKQKLQLASNGGPRPATVPPSVSQTLAAPGRPLDVPTRSFMESRFGQDFSRVRIHDDARAGESAREVNARAYTVGQDIIFAPQQYQPATEDGAALIAHELSHTVQQGGLHRSATGTEFTISSASDPFEQEATTAAVAVMQGQALPGLSRGSSAVALHRATWGVLPAGTKRKLNEDLGKLLKKRAAGAEAAKAKKPGFFTYQVAEAAEDYIAEHFRAQRGRYAHTNKRPLQPTLTARPETEPIQYMINEAADHFRSGGSSRTKKKSKAPGTPPPKTPAPRAVTIPVEPAALEEHRAEEAAASPREGAQLKPDFVDFEKSEVYDATTVDVAADKVNKLEGYRDLYDEIRESAEYGPIGVPKWSVGTTLAAPSKLTFGLQNEADPIKISFAATDFSLFPGVLAYVVVDTSVGDEAAEGTEAAETVARVDYPISAGAATAVLKVPATFATTKGASIKIAGDAENNAAATLIPGLVLIELRHKFKTKTTPDVIAARIDATGLPLAVDEKAAPVTLSVSEEGVLKLDAASKKLPNLPFDYKYLSPGKITDVDVDASGETVWKGSLTPAVPLLGPLGVEYSKRSLLVTKGLDENALKKRSVLGMRVTKAQIQLQLAPEFKPEGVVELQMGAEANPLAQVRLTISADDTGLVAQGKLNVNIPKMKKAESAITYKGGGGRDEWVADIHIKSEDIKLGSSVSVSGGFDGAIDKGGINFVGKISATFPNDNTAELGLRKAGEDWILFGGGKFHFPKLDETTVSVTYNLGKDVLVATGSTGFTIPSVGLSGRLDPVTFTIAKDQPVKVSGKGGLDFKKGKAEGHVTVHLHPDGKFSGKGSLSYQIKPNIIVTGTVELNEQEKLRVTGELLVTRYEIFKQYGDKKDLFTVDVPIPLPPPLAIGTTGLVFHIRGGVGVAYSFGPGVLEPLKFSAGFDPLEADPDLTLAVTGTLKIPASATLSAFIEGSLAIQVDIVVGSAGVEGGLRLTGELTLSAGAFANFDAAYKKKRLTAKLVAGIDTKLLLGVSLTAFAHAWAGAFGLKAETKKDWTLARKVIDTGLGFYISAPFEYADDTGVKLPELKDITLKKPDITTDNLKRILGEIFKSSSENVKES